MLIGLLLLPLLQQGLAGRSQNLLLSALGLIVAYLIAIYLYKAVAVLAYHGKVTPVVIAGLIAVVAAGLLDPANRWEMSLFGTASVPLTGLIVGHRARTDRNQLRIYAIGAAAVLVCGLIMYASSWSEVMKIWRLFAADYVVELEKNMKLLGYHADVAAEYGREFTRLMNGVARVIPAVLVSYPLMQYSVGFLWLMHSGLSADAPAGRLAPFKTWKVPFGLAPVLILVILGRLFGGETITLVADNLLLLLSVTYCVGGLALIGHLLGRLRLPVFVKIMFYIMLTLTGVIGFLMTVLIGFVDSFADWRKAKAEPIELKKK